MKAESQRHPSYEGMAPGGLVPDELEAMLDWAKVTVRRKPLGWVKGGLQYAWLR